MTIRETFKRRRKYFNWIGLAVVIAVVVVWGQTHPTETRLHSHLHAMAFGLVFAVVLLPIAYWLFRCPRCGTTFSKYRREKLGRWSMDTRGADELWDSCPKCGVSFDAPWSANSP
jgi:hypothetical protein